MELTWGKIDAKYWSFKKTFFLPGSGPLGAVAQTSWFGHPAHASDFPADSDCGPGQSKKTKERK
jgi:hypothetical protein